MLHEATEQWERTCAEEGVAEAERSEVGVGSRSLEDRHIGRDYSPGAVGRGCGASRAQVVAPVLALSLVALDKHHTKQSDRAGVCGDPQLARVAVESTVPVLDRRDTGRGTVAEVAPSRSTDSYSVLLNPSS